MCDPDIIYNGHGQRDNLQDTASCHVSFKNPYLLLSCYGNQRGGWRVQAGGRVCVT